MTSIGEYIYINTNCNVTFDTYVLVVILLLMLIMYDVYKGKMMSTIGWHE